VHFWRTVQQRISSLPGVTSAGISNQGMLNGWENIDPGPARVIQGDPPKAHGLAGGWRAYITPRFFESIGLPLVAGRDFTPHDTEKSPRVMIVNDSMARYYFGDAAGALGRRMSNSEGSGVSEWVEIVGVVKDPIGGTPRQTKAEFTYFPYRQLGRAMSRMCIAVHTTGDPHGLIAGVRGELHDIDPSIPILRIDTVSEQLNDVLVEDRIVTALATFFGVLGTALASVGLFGLLAYSAARRTNEIGIRMALGATRRSVVLMVLREALLLTAAGVAIGIPATLAGTRLISAKLFGVSAADPLTIAAAAVLMAAVAALAGWLPAVRASNVDPMTALRYE
jgi:predicted permease